MPFRFLCVMILSYYLFQPATLASCQEQNAVVISGIVVIRFYGNAVETGKKAEAITKRLEEKIKKGARPADIGVRPCEGGVGIFWGDSLIVVADEFQSKKNATSPLSLAQVWRSNIVAALSPRPLQLSEKILTMPVGVEKSVSVKGGNGKESLQVSYDSSLLDVKVDSENVNLCVLAKVAASTQVTVQRGNLKSVLRVYAKDWAGKIVPEVEKQVTGNPAPPEVQQEAVLNGINDAVVLLPGSRLFLREMPRITLSLKPGYEQVVKVPVVIEGKGYFPVEGNVRIKVVNRSISLSPPKLLMVSNRPETLEEDGILLKGQFSAETPVRLLYSHKNASPCNRKLWITLKNLSPVPMQLFVAHANAGPDKYEIQTGHKAAMRYLEAFRCNAGYVLEVPGRKTIMLDEYDIQPQFIVSGICDLQIIAGKEAEIEVRTARDSNCSVALKEIDEPFDPFKIHPHGIFPSPHVELDRKFSTHDNELFIEVGKWPWLIDSTTGEPNTGNYGVLYKISVQLINETSCATRLGVSFIPMNGLSMGSVLIDGALFETGIVRLDEQVHLTEVNLAPGERRTLQIVTFPEAGSCYPVNIRIGRMYDKASKD